MHLYIYNTLTKCIIYCIIFLLCYYIHVVSVYLILEQIVHLQTRFVYEI